MADIRYNDIISAAITDFNSIQNALAGLSHSEHYVHDLDTASTALTTVDNADGSKVFPTKNFGSIISGQLQLAAYDTLTINDSNVAQALESGITGDSAKYASVIKVKQGSINNSGQSFNLDTRGTNGTSQVKWGSSYSSSGGYTLTATLGSVPVNIPITSGYITGGSSIPVDLTSIKYTIPNAAYSFDPNNTRVTLTSAGYLGSNIGLSPASGITITGASDISVANALTLKTDDSSTVSGTNVYSELFSLGDVDTTKGTDVTKYSNVTTSETDGTKYIAFTASSNGGTSNLGLHVTTPGVLNSTVAGTVAASVSVVGNSAVTYYYPVKEASVSLSAPNTKTTAATPTLTVTGLGASTGSLDDSRTIAATVTAPETKNIAINKSVTAGLLDNIGRVNGTTETAASSQDYTIRIPNGAVAFQNGKVAVTKAGYVDESTTMPSVEKTSLSASINSIVANIHDDTTDGKSATAKDPSDSSGTKTLDIFTTEKPKSGDYYEIVASGSASVGTGYISASTLSLSKSGYYLPKAEFEYVADSSDTNYVRVSKGGYLPAGSLTEISNVTGTIDHASINLTQDIADESISVSGSKYVFTPKITDFNGAGYFDSDSKVSGDITIPKGAVSGGGVSATAYSGTGNSTYDISNTLSNTYITTTATGNYPITISSSKAQITRAAISVTNGYVKSSTDNKGADTSVIVGATTPAYYIQSAAVTVSSQANMSTNTTSTSASGDKAKAWVQGDSNQPTSYVTVTATSSGNANVTTGGIYTAGVHGATSAGSATVRIKAAVKPSISVSSSSPTVGSVSTFNPTTGKVTKGAKTAGTSGTATIGENYADTYIVGGFTSQSYSGNGTATIQNEATGSAVDDAFESLYERMLGRTRYVPQA